MKTGLAGTRMALFPLHTICTATVLLVAIPATTAVAQGIHRSVDAQGNVTYSDKPPANAVKVDKVNVQPGPSDAAQREARERAQRDAEKANEMRETRERLQQKQATKPAAPEPPPVPVASEGPVDYSNAYPDTGRRGQVRDRPDKPPVQLPDRPVQLPARPGPR